MANGQLKSWQLTRIPGGQLASGAPARSWLAMRYYIGRKTKGQVWLTPTGPNSSYRTYTKQVEYWNAYRAGRGPLAARPGTSNHGVGRAVDLPNDLMQRQARRYGHLFGWGVAGGKLPSDAPTEPWHCTFRKWTPMAALWFARYKVARKRKK